MVGRRNLPPSRFSDEHAQLPNTLNEQDQTTKTKIQLSEKTFPVQNVTVMEQQLASIGLQNWTVNIDDEKLCYNCYVYYFVCF